MVASLTSKVKNYLTVIKINFNLKQGWVAIVLN